MAKVQKSTDSSSLGRGCGQNPRQRDCHRCLGQGIARGDRIAVYRSAGSNRFSGNIFEVC